MVTAGYSLAYMVFYVVLPKPHPWQQRPSLNVTCLQAPVPPEPCTHLQCQQKLKCTMLLSAYSPYSRHSVTVVSAAGIPGISNRNAARRCVRARHRPHRGRPRPTALYLPHEPFTTPPRPPQSRQSVAVVSGAGTRCAIIAPLQYNFLMTHFATRPLAPLSPGSP